MNRRNERLDEIARLRERLRELGAEAWHDSPEVQGRRAAYADTFGPFGATEVCVERRLLYEGPADRVAEWLALSQPVGQVRGPPDPLRLTIYESEPVQDVPELDPADAPAWEDAARATFGSRYDTATPDDQRKLRVLAWHCHCALDASDTDRLLDRLRFSPFRSLTRRDLDAVLESFRPWYCAEQDRRFAAAVAPLPDPT